MVRVLIADNDPDVVDLVAMDLALEGYDIVGTAASGESAAEECARLRPDILVVDYRMPPGWNGIQTIEEVRRAGTARLIVLYTNYRSPELARQSRRLGAVHVSKGPLRNLRSTLAQLLEESDEVS